MEKSEEGSSVWTIGKDLSTALVACRQFGQLGFSKPAIERALSRIAWASQASDWAEGACRCLQVCACELQAVLTPLFSASDSLFAFRCCRSTRGGGTTWLRRAFANMAVLDVGLGACQVACSCLGLLSAACKPSEGAGPRLCNCIRLHPSRFQPHQDGLRFRSKALHRRCRGSVDQDSQAG